MMKLIEDVNILRPRQTGRHFADNSFKRIFMDAKFYMLIQISLKSVPKGPIDNKAVLVHVMAWRRTGDKPLSEPMLTQFIGAYMLQYGEMSQSAIEYNPVFLFWQD